MIAALAMSLSSVFVVSNALRLKLFELSRKKKEKGDFTMKKTIIIEGMACEHCAGRVREALLKLDGIADVRIDLGAKKAEITLTKEIDDALLKSTVDAAGYTALSIG